MKNLEKFGVETLKTQEMREIDGGFLVALACLAVAAVALSSCQANVTIQIGDENSSNGGGQNRADSTANGSGNGSGNGNGN